jgi:hypothetical protein
MRAQIGDWIIKGIQGEFYPCKPDIFKATYEPMAGPYEEERNWYMVSFALHLTRNELPVGSTAGTLWLMNRLQAGIPVDNMTLVPEEATL